MTVVSNTSPLNYLTLIGLERLLPTLFGRVIIPLAVQEELKSPGAPVEVRDLLDRSRGWLEAVNAPSVSNPSLLAWIRASRKPSVSPPVWERT